MGNLGKSRTAKARLLVKKKGSGEPRSKRGQGEGNARVFCSSEGVASGKVTMVRGEKKIKKKLYEKKLVHPRGGEGHVKKGNKRATVSGLWTEKSMQGVRGDALEIFIRGGEKSRYLRAIFVRKKRKKVDGGTKVKKTKKSKNRDLVNAFGEDGNRVQEIF